ncbi:Gag-pol Polyprotein [Phytophthora palmivora]|uniref:Gag-pol Polyprotein n=1 Tax=Phytophthora palmivora TaxID=4796 RepID=A0A2P4YNR2_9STRA|nr:Gag-pol Polyprotein [Phytophthora palmivora]
MEDNGWEMTSKCERDGIRKIYLDLPRTGERLEFSKKGKHYWLKTVERDDLVDGVAMLAIDADANALMRWHERLGHLNVAAIKHMMDHGTVAGMNIPAELFKKHFKCLSCMSAKRKRMSYKSRAAEKRTKINYERLMSDTCDMGKYLPGFGATRYFQLIQDEGSRYKWCFPLKHKNDANAKTTNLMTELLAQGHRIKTFTSDVEKRTKINYERLMSDTCDMGKYLPGFGATRYFQLIQDEGSRYKWCFPLKHKNDANANTINLMTELLAQGHRIKTFTSDGGGEYINAELRLIRHIPTHSYSPEENALVEKLNGVLVNKMRAAMHAAELPNRLWPEVLQYIVDIAN